MRSFNVGEIIEIIRDPNTNYDDLLVEVWSNNQCRVLERRSRYKTYWKEVTYDKDRLYNLDSALTHTEEVISHGMRQIDEI